ncbi:hypothetical protein [Emcibacter nanhaiensis]|uniref:Uncharacterized protein n=1 Tax=Emcibacter nanhaiensis TaxID=1505037 RepID=A0A501PSJ4_9PROT|nr:hypothetical protein [Emcibacter nanhaiensis]TPD62756.1 hypothetical protein FIV46_01370 [Emcibacter nanhaiensis]
MESLFHFSSLFLLTGLAVFILFPLQSFSQELNLSSPQPGNLPQSYRIDSNYTPARLLDSDTDEKNNHSYPIGYFINLKYKIKKDIYFLVGRKVTHTVDPRLYAPPGSYEFNPGLTLNRAPSLGQFGFIIRY